MLLLKRGGAGLLALIGLQGVQADELAAGSAAPKFTLLDQEAKTHTLANYRGRWVVLYFYPKDDTPGCTTEACNFRDNLPALRALNVQILGISMDDTKSHARFAEKYRLPFPLLADTEGGVARAYGALWSIGPMRIAKRHTFVIDPEGRIANIYRNVRPASHSRELQQDIKELQKGMSGMRKPGA
ncbi:MAG TPA: peroxiredoxin [Acidiferrobacterales bacterium]|nr:peroxiredoxin [Acidiferrobacterales bacterium]